MTDQANATESTAQEFAPETIEAATKMAERFEKSGYILVEPGDDQEALSCLLSSMSGQFVDFTEESPDTYNRLSLVKTKGGEVRFVSLPPPEEALADKGVQEVLYRRYLATVIKAARDDEMVAAQFVTPAGMLKPKFDDSVYNELWKLFAKVLRKKGLPGINKASLRSSLASADFATGMFPKMTNDQWNSVIAKWRERGELHGMSVQLLDFWAQTREARKDASSAPVDLSDLDALVSEADDADDESETGTEGNAS